MNIVLIGFCSCGKSSAAYELSKRLKMKFIDMDKEIEVRYYLRYGEELHYRNIILKEGPELFFQIENKILSELVWFKDCVIATGGGCPLRQENRKILSELGTIIYLKTAPEEAFRRMKAKGIPLFLRADPSMDNLKRIWQERHAVYESLADYELDNSDLSIEKTTERIIAILKDDNLLL
jgi:shikimate kinase